MGRELMGASVPTIRAAYPLCPYRRAGGRHVRARRFIKRWHAVVYLGRPTTLDKKDLCVRQVGDFQPVGSLRLSVCVAVVDVSRWQCLSPVTLSAP